MTTTTTTTTSTTTTLWFRLDDVLPLAEHAMACPEHRITEAQLAAHAALGPALDWVGAAHHDLLLSNGQPAWHTPHGRLHSAAARTWRHRTTGRSGTARRGTYDHAYLPLDIGVSQHKVIDRLREARHQHRTWLTIGIDPADGHLIPAHRVHTTEHRHELAPSGSQWIPATVTCPALAHTGYPALVPTDYTTADGHELPRFDRPTVERIRNDLHDVHTDPNRQHHASPAQFPTLQFSGDALVVLEQRHDGIREFRTETDRIHPDLEARYALGANTWPWRLTGS